MKVDRLELFTRISRADPTLGVTSIRGVAGSVTRTAPRPRRKPRKGHAGASFFSLVRGAREPRVNNGLHRIDEQSVTA